MEITKIIPQGLCKGVISAIKKVNEAIENPNTKKPIHMLGPLIHNKNVVRAFLEKGVIIHMGKSRLELLDEITDGTVIFTAHGVSDEVRAKAISKGLDIIDATCRDVSRNQQIIKDKINDGYYIFFYGKENHPETEGIFDSEHIIVVNENTDIDALPEISGKMVMTTQTTMSYSDVVPFYLLLKRKYPQLELLEELCNATRKRQEAIINQAGNLDLLLVVGDPSSNNSKMLMEIAKNKLGVNAIMLENVEDLNHYDLSPYQKIGITSGASTPTAIVEEIIQQLQKQKKNFISKLKNDDYLKY
ncbi:MAG: 4-hydroxy-3-methylbut-2-enyl diphosphate reductase [Acholeplasmataceae bacterium]|nr:4-hydroxy-3-methylbut-2-enyl diphosphate reductase [Acholeplasmataceae bacterium]